MSSPDFDNQTLAVLRGRMVRYLMRSREVSSVFHSAVPKTKEVNSLLPAWIMERKLNHFSTTQIKCHNQAAFDFEVHGVFVCFERSKTLGYFSENILIEEQFLIQEILVFFYSLSRQWKITLYWHWSGE